MVTKVLNKVFWIGLWAIVAFGFIVFVSTCIREGLPTSRIDLANKVFAQTTQGTIYLTSTTVATGTGLVAWQKTASTTSTNINFAGVNPIFHQFSVNAINAPGKTCTNWVTAYMQGSYDNSYWITLNYRLVSAIQGGPTFDRTALGSQRTYQAVSASYPYLRVVVPTVDNTNCLFMLGYAGSIYPATLNDPSYIAGTLVTSTTAVQQLSTEVTSAGLNTLVTNATTKIGVTVYGLTINNLTSPQDVYFTDESGTNIYWKVRGLTAGQTIVLPFTGKPYFSTVNNSGELLKINLLNATAVEVNILYRNE